MKQVVLASSSPRRRKILEEANLRFIVDPSKFDESQYISDNPYIYVQQLSLKKAKEVALRHEHALIISADTTVFCKNKIFGKPASLIEARSMLRFLSGKSHKVITGFAVINTDTNQHIVDSDEATVYFKKLSEKDIEAYIKTPEPYDKAGGYAIQEGLSKYFVEKVEGDFKTIVGLPLSKVQKALSKLGL